MFIITGANGFIGSALVKELNDKKTTEIICVDRVSLSQRGHLLGMSEYKEFISSDEFLKNLESYSDIDCVFHLGACSDTTETNRDFLRENNTIYTEKLFTWCANSQIPFVYASSAAVYGDGKNGFDDRKSPEEYMPLNPYGESKLNFDQWVVKQKQAPPRWYGLRFFNVFGYNESHKKDMSSLVYKAFQQIKISQRLKLFKSYHPKYEDGRQMRDFIYVKDITRWLWELYEKPNVASGIYNMGFGKAQTWLNLASAVFQSVKKPVNIEWIEIPENIRDQYQYFTEANMSKLNEQSLGKPTWPLKEAIEDYIINDLM